MAIPEFGLRAELSINYLGLAKQLMSGLGLIPMIEICDDGMYAGCTSREMDR